MPRRSRVAGAVLGLLLAPACLEALAYGIGRRDQWAAATRLFAAAEAMRDATRMPLMRADRTRQERERETCSASSVARRSPPRGLTAARGDWRRIARVSPGDPSGVT